MNDQQIKNIVEAVLFAMGEPISCEKIAESLEEQPELVEAAMLELMSDYDQRLAGICILQMENRYQLATRPTYVEFVRKALNTRRNTPLSTAAMETLAIIAYNQPVTRSFIEQVRGVDSSSSVSGLLDKGLVAEAGRLNLPGRPISFRTTDVFLRSFGMNSLEELPPARDQAEQLSDMMVQEDE
ncbi:MAG: SMC-Scp complex subunit ScpB [Oscillospiraceae bacterium]|nr:SMC-Scp complex subunit ScpB [Oscillospiraceae bacterium]